jgi:poly-gamma-glutamate capsule biosynthesis protein CapA/YwtB (metallophosphatase superfamily)
VNGDGLAEAQYLRREDAMADAPDATTPPGVDPRVGVTERNDRAAPRPITIAIAGDVMLGRYVNEVIRERGHAYPWGELLPTLYDVDLFLVNLECAITSETKRWHDGSYKPFHFRADCTSVETLRVGRVDFAALANNHIGDFGHAGLLETIAVLDRAGISHAGAGENLTAALTPARIDALGARVAVVSFADYPEQWAAGPSSPGMAFVPVSVTEDFAPVAEALEQARRDADVVVISMHWGPNFGERPPRHFRDFAHRALECGADIFWGHSAHIVQGIEVRNGKLILYDTGDFVDDYAVEPNLRNDLSMLFLVRISPPFIERLELIPVHIRSCQVNPATGAGRDWIVRRVRELSAELGTVLTTADCGLRTHISREVSDLPTEAARGL